MIVQEVYKKITEFYRYNSGREPKWVIMSQDVYDKAKKEMEKHSLVWTCGQEYETCCGLFIAVLPDKEKRDFLELA